MKKLEALDFGTKADWLNVEILWRDVDDGERSVLDIPTVFAEVVYRQCLSEIRESEFAHYELVLTAENLVAMLMRHSDVVEPGFAEKLWDVTTGGNIIESAARTIAEILLSEDFHCKFRMNEDDELVMMIW